MNSVEDFKNDPDGVLAYLYSVVKKKSVSILVNKFPSMASDSDEIFHEAVVIMWEKIEKNIFTSGYLEAYLNGVIRNLALARNRQHKKDWKLKEMNSVERIMNSDQDASAQLNKERITLIIKALNEMGDPCKKLLTIFYLDRKSKDEIIKIMGFKNANTLKTKKYKCMKRLQKIVKDISDRK